MDPIEQDPALFASWNNLAANLAYICWAAGILIALGYFVRLSTTSDSKSRYDFINKNEISVLWIAAIVMIVGAGFYFNSTITRLSTLWVFVRLIVQNLLKFYYPFFIEKRLKVLRYKPRISPKTGKPMKLLSEEEEDAYLDEGMQAEENVFSVDYDVWKDEETGYIKIEKYAGHLHAIQCPECNYQTFKVVKEEIIRQPSATEEGELLKHYQCSYCGYKAKKTVHLKQSAKVEQSTTAAA
jgi:uncharacterized membrane protein